jgi:predicted TIM-barrel fold metal-dependent hydrolase
MVQLAPTPGGAGLFMDSYMVCSVNTSHGVRLSLAILIAASSFAADLRAQVPPAADFNDSHFHLTNYIQRGPDVAAFLRIMGTRVGRSTLFGIPLQQTWVYANSGSYAPAYYLDSDAPLYFYSFSDAWIAMQYRSLPPAAQQRFEPMITGFNPADMYAVDHIRRVLTAFPGVFSGIGEFSVHKEFVSSKVAGEGASLTNPALDSILAFAGEAGLVVILHCDIDRPFASTNVEPVYLTQMKALLRRHPGTTIIWAHMGLGRVVHPAQTQGTSGAGEVEKGSGQIGIVESILADPAMRHVYFDISWDEVAKYIVATPASIKVSADLFNKYPDRFLFGTDNVAPTDPKKYYAVFDMYAPLWSALTAETSEKVRKGNYAHLFEDARRKVRAWEASHSSGGR